MGEVVAGLASLFEVFIIPATVMALVWMMVPELPFTEGQELGIMLVAGLAGAAYMVVRIMDLCVEAHELRIEEEFDA